MPPFCVLLVATVLTFFLGACSLLQDGSPSCSRSDSEKANLAAESLNPEGPAFCDYGLVLVRLKGSPADTRRDAERSGWVEVSSGSEGPVEAVPVTVWENTAYRRVELIIRSDRAFLRVQPSGG